MTSVRQPRLRKGFTLLEMLVVIGIITLLAAILIPVVSQVRMRAFVAQTQGEMARLMMACQSYYHDYNAYPGPLANNSIVGAPSIVDAKIQVDQNASPAPTAVTGTTITSSENLVLGLLGLLSAYPSAPAPNVPAAIYTPPPPKHDPMSLNFLRPSTHHYLDFLPAEIPVAGATGADYFAYATTQGGMYQADYNPNPGPPPHNDPETVSDSGLPEFIDHIPNPMPILYMRANRGATAIAAPDGTATYNYLQLKPYGFIQVKADDFPAPAGFTETHGGWDVYLMNPSLLNQPRGKDAFVLIDAGPDRLFGTKDDIIVTP